MFCSLYYCGQLSELKIGRQVKVSDMGKSDHRSMKACKTVSDKAEFTKTIQTRDERANLVYIVKIAVKNDGYIKRNVRRSFV